MSVDPRVYIFGGLLLLVVVMLLVAVVSSVRHKREVRKARLMTARHLEEITSFVPTVPGVDTMPDLPADPWATEAVENDVPGGSDTAELLSVATGDIDDTALDLELQDALRRDESVDLTAVLPEVAVESGADFEAKVTAQPEPDYSVSAPVPSEAGPVFELEPTSEPEPEPEPELALEARTVAEPMSTFDERPEPVLEPAPSMSPMPEPESPATDEAVDTEDVWARLLESPEALLSATAETVASVAEPDAEAAAEPVPHLEPLSDADAQSTGEVMTSAREEAAAYALVAPVELHFTEGEGRVGVRPGTRTYAEFQRMAGVILGDLERARRS